MDPLTLSFEFFPPKTTKGDKNLTITAVDLLQFHPAFFSVTYGAGGSTQTKTQETVHHLQQLGKVDVAPHISCIGSSKQTIHEMLQFYIQQGAKRLVALRGDFPSGMGSMAGDFHYGSDLVRFIREQTGDHFYIEVAAYPEFHPEAQGALIDLKNFKEKISCGANGAITQYFYNAEAYFRFIEICHREGITIPIVPGIMPIASFDRLVRFSKMCGAEIPLWLYKRLQNFADDLTSLREFGIEVVTQLCETLIEGGAPGLHFYTLNQVEPTKTIVNHLITGGMICDD